MEVSRANTHFSRLLGEVGISDVEAISNSRFKVHRQAAKRQKNAAQGARREYASTQVSPEGAEEH
jgi:hypothetical protein